MQLFNLIHKCGAKIKLKMLISAVKFDLYPHLKQIKRDYDFNSYMLSNGGYHYLLFLTYYYSFIYLLLIIYALFCLFQNFHQLTFLSCRETDKLALLVYLLKYVIKKNSQTVVFAATKHHVEFLHQVCNVCSHVY